MALRISTHRPSLSYHGALFANHSLALSNREICLELLNGDKLDLSLVPFGPEESAVASDQRFAALRGACVGHGAFANVAVRHQWPPDFVRPACDKFVLMQPWEFGSIPTAWVQAIEREVDEVWSCSDFVRQCYVESGVPADKVVVVPLGVNPVSFHPGVEPFKLHTTKSFKFLFVGGTIARKGIDILLDAYTRAFTSADDVSLIIKDFGATSFYKGQDAHALIAGMQAKPGGPEIIHLREDLTESEVAGLYTACDCLAHPYRGEGFGLPIAEAMACGTPAIVTQFGAALDFANSDNAFLVRATPVRLAEKRVGDMPTVDFPYWAEVDREALIETMKHVAANPDQAKRVGKIASVDISQNWTWAKGADVIANRVRDLAAQPVRRKASESSVVMVSTTPQDPESRKQAALASARAGNWELAVKQIAACLGSDPSDWDLLNALGVALYRTGDTDGAVTVLTDGAARCPAPRDFHHNLAFVWLGSGNSAAALEQAALALSLSPENTDVQRTFARARAEVLRQARKLRRGGKSKGALARQDSAYTELTAAVTRAQKTLENVQNTQVPVKQAAKLSVVMIAKNEEAFLEDCLKSVQGIADEIVLVDTGSTDRTVEIAKRYGAVVVSHPWNDDFAEARNVALDHATGNWGLWLDADERLTEGDADNLRRLMADSPESVGGYLVNIRNYMQLAEDAEICWHRACRVFRLGANTRFTGRIHEQNVRSLQAAGYTISMCKLTIDHWGYAASVMSERNKHERFIRMLTREVEESPDDSYKSFHLFNLGNAYYTSGNMQAAADWFEKAAVEPNPTEEYTAMLYVEWATALYMLQRPEETFRVCARAEAVGIVHPALDFARGHAALHQQEYAAADRYFKSSVEKGRGSVFAHVGDPGAYSFKAMYGRGLALLGQEKFAQAIVQCRESLAMKPDFLDARYLLACCLRRDKQLTEARREYHTLLEGRPDHPLAVPEYAETIYEIGDCAAALSPLRNAVRMGLGGPDIALRLADACEKLQLFEEARDLYLRERQSGNESAEICVNLGRAYAGSGDAPRAIDCFADAIAVDPSHSNAYFNAGDVLYNLGYYSKAAETLCAGLGRDPLNASGFFVLGNCYFQTRDYAAACMAYGEALKRQPEYDEAGSNLALAEQMLRAVEAA